MRETMEFLAKKLVDDPASVAVKEFQAENMTMIEISCANEDVGKLIGKGGETADLLRKLLYKIASKEKKRCFLQINQ